MNRQVIQDYGENIRALEELERNLQSLECDIEWTFDGLTAQANILMHGSENVGILDVFMPKGMVFKKHHHEKSVEFLICYEGKILVDQIAGKKILRPGESARFPKKEPHEITAIEDSKVLAIGVPRPKGFTNDQRRQ